MLGLTTAAELAWRVAGLEARRGRARAITPDHLTIALLSLGKLLEPAAGLDRASVAAVRPEQERLVALLGQVGLKAAALRRAIRAQLPPESGAGAADLHRDAACRALFERAEALARVYGSDAINALHLLGAALVEPTPALVEALPPPTIGLTAIERLRARVHAALAGRVPDGATRPTPSSMPIAGPAAGSANLPPSPPVLELATPPAEPDPWRPPGPTAPVAPPDRTPPVPPVLLRFGRDLTAEAEAGTLGPVIGRHDELLQVVRILRRRVKNSPVLIGEAGVGKTAVVEGLAHRIAEGHTLPGQRIVALSLASVVAGTTYRGQFEERLAEILAALRARPDVILFLDELHTIVGAGDSEGRLDTANILKPALARGEIRCIGATTSDEYRRYIESDPALERRFQPVLVAEPTPAETRAILDGLRDDLERHHGVRIEDDALDAAVGLTVRYVTARRLPDKAVDALDEACARVGVPTLTGPPMPGPDDENLRPPVTRQAVAEVVAAWTGVPVGQLGQDEARRLADLETLLGQRVVGQPLAIARVARRVRLARAGLADSQRPAGVLLFLGPSGVGKTELARALAEVALDGPAGQPRLIRLDMSEYGEKHSAARLIGAPPGYLGHDDEGQLTGPLRRCPYAVVLLDEVEKAHPEVFDLFLQLFDAGRLTDGQGRLVDGRQAIYVLTSNLLAGGVGRRALGFGVGEAGSGAAERAAPDREALLAELRGFFRPELLHRIDELIVFRPLDAADLVEIGRRQLEALRARLRDRHAVDLVISAEALELLARRALAGSGGAREVQRAIRELIEEPLSCELLLGRVGRGARLRAEARGEGVTLTQDAGVT